jgi:hypothetical protein
MSKRHSRLYPWYVGIAIIAGFELALGYLFLGPSCPCAAASPVPQVLFTLLLIVLPVIYLTLMFLALRSQE